METKKEIGGGIYRLNETLLSVNEELMENGGELTPELEDRLASAELTQVEVVDGLQTLITKVKSEDAILAEEIKRLQALKKSRANGLEGLKRYLLSYMLNNGIERIEGAFCKVSVASGRESLEVNEDVLIDRAKPMVEEISKNLPAYINLEVKVSKTELMNAVKDGEPIPAEAGAVIVRKPYLLIK